jgi:putative ABC transport system substrate-binding protein
MMRRIKIGLLFVMLSLLLVACGGGDSSTPADEEPEIQATEAPAEEEAMEEEEAPTEEPMEEEATEGAREVTIGMMKIVSHPALDSIQAGFLATMAEGGYVEGENLTVIDANAEGDIATLTTIAQQFVDEGVDMIVATSTPALQAAYNVTKDMENPIPIIFNAVTSPYAAGVANAPDDHPAWVLGTQIFPPIGFTFEMMQEVFPDATVIGYLYNPAEANSVAQYEEALPYVDELGYTLEIATVSNSSEVKTAAEALVARGIDFFYYSQDSTMGAGLEGLVQVANENVIPIITNDMPGVGRGVALGVGLDFTDDGIFSGQYAVDFLDGNLDLATAPILRVETTAIHYNTAAAELQGLTLPQSIIDAGVDQTPATEEVAEEKRDVTIGMMKIVSHPALDSIQAGFLATMAEGGYVEGENLTVIDANAEGDIATLTTIAQQFVDEGVDMIVATSTPALQAAYNVTKDMENPIPIIFNAVTSPYAAGVANAPDDHPAWVLGTQIFPPIGFTFEMMQEAFPGATVIGYLYNPAEANSVAQYEEALPYVDELGYKMEIATVSNSSEVKTAAEALVARGIDFFYYSQDSTMGAGLEGLVQVANENVIPIITNDMPGVGRGVALGVGLDFTDDGILSGQYAVDFLDGNLDLATAPILRVETTAIHYNTAAAELQGLTLPQSIIDAGVDQTP